MLKKILKYTQELQNIPNVPFLISPINNYIKSIMIKNNYDIVDNKYSLIVNASKNPGNQKLIIMAHTDHPGIIVKNKNEGIAMGTLEVDRLKKILITNTIALKIFSPSGKYLGVGDLTHINKNNRDVSLKINFDVPANSFAQYDLNYFKIDTKTVSAYSLDDTISVAIMLALLENKFKSNYDLYFVFNLYEEVHQISAWYLAKNNILKLNKNDLIVNLECQKVENIDSKKYSISNYDDGPILQLSNTGCLFGYNIKGENNSEKLIKSVARKAHVKLQTGLTMDSDDSRPFSNFVLTPNIVTLNIPNRFKHNTDTKGNIVLEKIFLEDVSKMYQIVEKAIQNTESFKQERSLSSVLKTKDEITNKKLMREKELLNNRLDIAYKSIIQRGYFYPLNLVDLIEDFICRVGFYLTFYLQKLSIITGIKAI